MHRTKGWKIRVYESIYEQYSGLIFTKYEDKPLAIAGLEQRLKHAFNTSAANGIFNEYLERSLLWMRDARIEALKRIDFSRTRTPSWSWMAYEGAITHLRPPFDGVNWEKENIRSPWTAGARQATWSSAGRGSVNHLEVIVRAFLLPLDHEKMGIVIFDDGRGPEGRAMKCVVFGRLKTTPANTASGKSHYVLIVSLKPDTVEMYERIGVGFVPGTWIAAGESQRYVELV